jgi:putative acetyltransferase
MSGFTIIEALSPESVAQAKALFEEYAAGLPFSLCFQGFEAELASLPGRYAPPAGCLLLAVAGPGAVGCVALREIDGDASGRVCEMKRLYVRPSHRGAGVGLALCGELLGRARRLGYGRMKLDTSGDMRAAQALYRALGFVPCDRYNNDPLEDTLYFELVLGGGAARSEE